MKLPRSLQLGPYTYIVEALDPVEAEASNCRGRILHHEGRIQLLMTHSEDRIKETLFHELLHAAYITGDIQEDATEEEVVEPLAKELMTYFKQNPKLKDILFL